MSVNNRVRQWGFTLVELAMVIVILGVLSAIAIPKYVALDSEALTAAQQNMIGAVKSALAITTVDLGRYPTMSELAANTQGVSSTSTMDNYGLAINIDGTSYVVPVYINFDCTARVALASHSVLCVGDSALDWV